MTDNAQYRKSYGRPGTGPVFTRCCVEVSDPIIYSLWTQCARKRGHGPDEAYCKQHDPVGIAERSALRDAKYQFELDKKRVEWAGPRLLKALHDIANGHSAPRAVAIAAIKDLPVPTERKD